MASSIPPDLRPSRAPAKPPTKPPVKAKAPVKPKAAPTKTGMAGLFGGVGPEAYINNLYAPQETQVAQQQAARQAGLQHLVGSILAAINAPQPDRYGAAAQDATSAANAAAASLARANPNAATQAGLQAIGAPQAQQDQVGNQNNVVFNGQGALGQYVSGALPAGVFAQDQAANQTYQRSLPGIVGLGAIQGLGSLSSLASKENSTLQSNKIQDLQTARGDLANYVQANQKAKAAAASTAFDQAYKLQQAADTRAYRGGELSLRQGSLALQGAKYRTGVNEFNAKQDLAQQKISLEVGHWKDLSAQSWARIGISTRNAQLRAKALDQKQKRGGFTPYQLNKFNSTAYGIAKDALNGYTDSKGKVVAPRSYQAAMDWMIRSGVPPAIAVKSLNSIFPETRRPITDTTRADYAQTTGQIPNLVPLARKYNLDANAVLSVAAQEGLGGGVGDNGTSFGPFQLHIGGALPAAIGAKGAAYAHRWAWSPAGIDYALSRMATVAGGLRGQSAINAIVSGFERPANVPNEIAGASSYYNRLNG